MAYRSQFNRLEVWQYKISVDYFRVPTGISDWAKF
jgi:hypothetical protein